MAQAAAWADPKRRLEVVSRMYRLRFPEPLDAGLSLEQIRGMEGVRVREAYARASRETGVVWSGRAYKRGDWGAADPVNRAAEVSVPAAFAAAAEGATGVETRARRRVREKFLEEKLLQRVVPDIQRVLGMKVDATLLVAHAASRDGEASAFLEEDDEAPGALWDPEKGLVEGGRNFAESEGGAVGEEQEGGEAR